MLLKWLKVAQTPVHHGRNFLLPLTTVLGNLLIKVINMHVDDAPCEVKQQFLARLLKTIVYK